MWNYGRIDPPAPFTLSESISIASGTHSYFTCIFSSIITWRCSRLYYGLVIRDEPSRKFFNGRIMDRGCYFLLSLFCAVPIWAHTRTTRIYHFNIIRKVKFSLFYAWMERNKTINLNYYSMFPNNTCYVSCQNFYAIPNKILKFSRDAMHGSWLYNEITTQSSFELFWWICLSLIVINSKLNESKSWHVIFNFCFVFLNIHWL